jgi:hypothetical protein
MSTKASRPEIAQVAASQEIQLLVLQYPPNILPLRRGFRSDAALIAKLQNVETAGGAECGPAISSFCMLPNV